MAQKELDFEKQLIQALTTGEVLAFEDADDLIRSGKPAKTELWEYKPEIKTEEQLWANFKEILEKNNFNKLFGVPLSETEFAQVKREIERLETPYQAGQFLYGTNGISQVYVEMDDRRKVYLTVFDHKQIGGGNTVYQVVNQIRRPAVGGYKQAIFDTTLLINGLPIIQIEEKSETNNVKQALEQIHRYIHEGRYRGIFSTLQILVAMTPHSIRYMANTTDEAFNTDFAFQWQRKGGKEGDGYNTITDWKEFTDYFLSIPMAHRMSTDYMVLDGTPGKQKLITMRPYQVYATQEVIHSIQKKGFDSGTNKAGYVWHTTGSGKTVTSFKTAWIAKNLPTIDKVVFLVDRKNLTRQTVEKYSAYDPENGNDAKNNSVLESESITKLGHLIKSNDNNIVIASTQKMMGLVKRPGFKTPDKNILFIVDEAHRTTGGDSFETIQNKFPNALFVGYTGTPEFTGGSAKTTREIFGDMLHAYTIREAIADDNVLGFNVSFKNTIPVREMLPEFYRQQHPEWTEEQIQEEVLKEIPEGVDDERGASLYDKNKSHIHLVVKDILENWENRSVQGRYNALFTTHVHGNNCSTPLAAAYYQEFKKQNQERAEQGLQPLKIGMTYSYSTDNSPNMMLGNRGLEEAIQDYNEMFDTNFDISTLDAYKDDLISRLNKSAFDGRYLDLVIVVDQLLTGFDAPELNALYVDRTLKDKLLIQAYSRTNRIHNMVHKPFGRIINYRMPLLNEEKMNEALAVYSNAASADIEDDGGGGTGGGGGGGRIIAKPFEEVLAETKEIVEKLKECTRNLNGIPNSESEREEMLGLLTAYSKHISMLKQYDTSADQEGVPPEYDPRKPETLFNLVGLSEEEDTKLTHGLLNELVEKVAQDRNVPPEQIEFEMVHIKEARINYDYLTELLNRLAKEVSEDRMEKAEKTKEELEEFSQSVDAPLAARIKKAANAIFRKIFKPSAWLSRHKDEDFNLLDEAVKADSLQEIEEFRKYWGMEEILSNEKIYNEIRSHMPSGTGNWEKALISDAVQRRGSQYQLIADEKVRTMSPVAYRKQFRQAFKALAEKLGKTI